jgi:hypothetical protein
MDKDRRIASVAIPLSGALEKKLVKSRSSGCRNCDASIPLRVVLTDDDDGVDNAPVAIGRSENRAIIILAFFIFCVLLVNRCQYKPVVLIQNREKKMSEHTK